ncbi:ROK family protein [Sulfurimonas autotrophica]|uniref:ROK family protein n=1 Tax=Sulfurimonas autotrophica (strain ATCC BAA-671 / DSM 16294 / JCM 11897 / OK10) TaxID=563040 RepID=E0UP62_SULAO|nr:ROK family protein [Sulfurimonas autotrophica]ADN08526.1 ROK family protein [Sulfurimonas autotrophica DSM 16294]
MKLGIDIGGTYLRYELRENDKTIKKSSLKSAQTGLCSFLEMILHEEKKISSIFIAYAGQVNEGVILSAPNITIDKHEIKAYIEAKYNVKLFIENDLNCAVLAEAKSCKTENICAVYAGTGLGLGVVSSSVLIKGSDNIATELGHIPYKDTPFTCNCGKHNCIELFCSGSGLLRWKEYYKLKPELSLEQLHQSKKDEAQKIYNEFIEALLYAVGTTITLFNPKVLVIGGGLIMHNRYLHGIIQERIKAYALPLALKNIKITISTLEDASLEGAFLLKDLYE